MRKQDYWRSIISWLLLFAILLFTSPFAVKAQAASDTSPNLQKLLTVESVILGAQDNMSLYYQDLGKVNNAVALSPERSWIPASTIKAYVVLEAYRQRRLGLINFNQVITIKPENVVPTELETNDYPMLTEGKQVTIQQLVGAMITQSDNTAYNTLLDILDRRNINSTLKDYGITETVVGEKLNLDDNQLAQDLAVPGRRPNTTTVKDYATLFNLLYTHKALDAEEILDVFRHQKINSMIPFYLPKDVTIAHKTGDWAPIYHDGGVVYKPNDPFILSVFTNANDTHIIAKLAQIAYYQDQQYVGDATAPNQAPAPVATRDQKRRYLAVDTKTLQRVLGTADEKFPQLTAADLGITPSDVKIDNQDITKIGAARIIPGSFLYPLKRRVETIVTTLTYPNETDRQLAFAKNRLSEAKTTLAQSDITKTNAILAESERNLQNAANSTTGKNKLASTVQIKQLNDFHYAVLAQNANQLTGKNKTAFIDMVYNFYQKDAHDVLPRVASTVITNPVNQQPLVGTVDQVSDTTIKMKLSDGTTKTIEQNDLTPVRDFNKTEVLASQTISVGNRIAVLGQVAENGTIIPQFILTNIPTEIPNHNAGVVIAVDPMNNTLQIEGSNGQVKTVKVSDSTILKSRDTTVSLEGITVGSHVTIYSDQPASSSAKPAPTNVGTGSATTIAAPSASVVPSLAPIISSILPSAIPQSGQLQTQSTATVQPSSTTLPITRASSSPLPSATPVSGQTATTQPISATTITVTTNSPGTNQVVVPSTSTPSPTSTPTPRLTSALSPTPKPTTTTTTPKPSSSPSPSSH